MVILTRSFRAVFRKESWMFCAGLLLSIADLLELNCQLPTAGPGRFEPAPNHSRFPSLPALKEQGGTRRQKHCFHFCRPDVSTIRRTELLFNTQVTFRATHD